MSSIAIAIAGLAVTATSVGLSASGALNPTYGAQPNLASSSKQLSDTEAALLPLQRGMSAAAQTGGKFTFSLPPGVDGSQYGFDKLPQGTTDTQQVEVFVPGEVPQNQAAGPFPGLAEQYTQLTGKPAPGAKPGAPAGQWVPYNAADFKEGGKYAQLGTPQLRTITGKNGTYTVDFAGYGAGETQAAIAKQEAANQLKLSQKYDPQFIASALAQEKEADPQGFAARQRENELIQQQINNPPTNPVADTLNSQVQNQVRAGKGLDDFDKATLDAGIAASLKARGGTAVGDYSQPLTTGAAGVARQQAGIQKGVAQLTSGASPEDIAYRREEQNLGNLSSLINGQTPESQFASLSNAQRGPTPQVAGPPLPIVGGGQSGVAGSAASQAYGTQLQNLQAQSNPWFSGVTTAINAASALGQAGYKPLAAPKGTP